MKRTTKSAKKSPAGNAVAAKMNNALLREITEIKALIVKAERHDVQARYQIAVHCQKVCEGDGHGAEYGDRAVLKLAKAMGWKKSSIYDYANVAKAWPDKKNLDELAGREDKYGKPLSWSHIVLLATAATAEDRDERIADTLTHGWSVRELRKKLPRSEAVDAPAADIQESKLPQRLAATAQNYVMQVTALKDTAATFGQDLAKQIQDADPADLGDPFLKQLKQARENLNGLLIALDKCIVRAEERRKSAVRPQDDWEDATNDQDEYDRYFGDPDPKEAVAGSV